jgi:hypothetical protein
MKFRTIITHFDIYPSKDKLTNVIKKVYWKVECIDNGKYYFETGEYLLPIASDKDFTAYDNLTKEQVLSWLTEVDFEKVKLELEQKIDAENNPTINLQLPWADLSDAPILPEPPKEEVIIEQENPIIEEQNDTIQENELILEPKTT